LTDATNLWKKEKTWKGRKETYLETSEASYHHDIERREREMRLGRQAQLSINNISSLCIYPTQEHM
jgi:hypothetical protein